MPGKKKGGKKKKKGGKKKRPKGMLEDPGVVVKRLYKNYLENCAKKKSAVCPGLKAMMKDCYENDRLIVKVSAPFDGNLSSFAENKTKLKHDNTYIAIKINSV